jgi:hypothetical protein
MRKVTMQNYERIFDDARAGMEGGERKCQFRGIPAVDCQRGQKPMITRRLVCGCLAGAFPFANTVVQAQPLECAVFTPDRQKATAPDEAIARLKAGNERFTAGKSINCDLMAQVRETANNQSPFAAIVGCIDSRVPPELVFDPRIGVTVDHRPRNCSERIHWPKREGAEKVEIDEVIRLYVHFTRRQTRIGSEGTAPTRWECSHVGWLQEGNRGHFTSPVLGEKLILEVRCVKYFRPA